MNLAQRLMGAGQASFTGLFEVYSEHGRLYETVKLRFLYPNTFPARNQPPNVYLLSHRRQWKNVANSHIEPDWKLCLFVPGESGIDFQTETSLNQLFAVITVFFIKQRIYQRRLIRSQFGLDSPNGLARIVRTTSKV